MYLPRSPSVPNIPDKLQSNPGPLLESFPFFIIFAPSYYIILCISHIITIYAILRTQQVPSKILPRSQFSEFWRDFSNFHKLNPPKSISYSAVLPTLLQIQHNCIFYLPSKSISFKPVIFPTSILSPHRLGLFYPDYIHRKFQLFMLRDAKHVNNRAVGAGECIY